jgi:hypothetical protein
VKFENKDLKVSFEIDDVITVPVQLMYWGAIDEAAGLAKFMKRWNGARMIVKEGSWKCKAFKDHLAAFNDETDPTITAIIMWSAQVVYDYITGLTDFPND